jgi:hypothetical protein
LANTVELWHMCLGERQQGRLSPLRFSSITAKLRLLAKPPGLDQAGVKEFKDRVPLLAMAATDSRLSRLWMGAARPTAAVLEGAAGDWMPGARCRPGARRSNHRPPHTRLRDAGLPQRRMNRAGQMFASFGFPSSSTALRPLGQVCEETRLTPR